MHTETGHRKFARGRAPGFSPARALIRRIVDSVADGRKYHLEVVFSDGSVYHSSPVGDPYVTIVLRTRAAEWRMAVGAMRVTFWGALAMALTAGVGALFGTVA